MTRTELIATIQPLARQIFSSPDLEITDQLGPANLPVWTSLTFTQLLTALEDTLNIKYKMMEIIKMQNMGAIIDITLHHLNA